MMGPSVGTQTIPPAEVKAIRLPSGDHAGLNEFA